MLDDETFNNTADRVEAAATEQGPPGARPPDLTGIRAEWDLLGGLDPAVVAPSPDRKPLPLSLLS